MSGNNTREILSLSSIASHGPQNVTVDSGSNYQTMPYGFGRQLPINPPSLSDINLPPNPFNILATDKNNITHSLAPSKPSPISTPRRNLSTIEGWETPHTTSDDKIFYSVNEPVELIFTLKFFTPLSTQKLKRQLSLGISFPKSGGVAARLRGLWTLAA